MSNYQSEFIFRYYVAIWLLFLLRNKEDVGKCKHKRNKPMQIGIHEIQKLWSMTRITKVPI